MKILFVCLGNICRSPMAEGIMRHLAPEHIVDSAGTSNYHIGHSPDQRMIHTAHTFGIDISNLKARQLTTDDFDQFDRIYVMDKSNYKNALTLAKTKEHQNKLHYTLENNEDVPDPYYGGEEGFASVYKLLLDACQRIKHTIG